MTWNKVGEKPKWAWVDGRGMGPLLKAHSILDSSPNWPNNFGIITLSKQNYYKVYTLSLMWIPWKSKYHDQIIGILGVVYSY